MHSVSDAELYEAHAAELIRFATGIVGPDDAADTLSEAVVGAISGDAWSTVDNKRAYLYRCVLNAAHSQQRSDARRRNREQHVAQLESRQSNSVNEPMGSPEFEAVRELSERQRAIVFLTYWEDLDPSTIADLLEISVGTVKQHLARARTHLRRELDV